ncbi:hypothetical protein [Streptococcus merionis]|uniref:Uncharacterized protein n=1 Tax=Streptococcus merionis TaxID=400065 RepID=A0A239SPZ3_9STRE|nr:hypothetical protein [Streptococcus merionis]SNU87332.1 Uncharacterised protein [Streptococcus merionis]
MIVDEFKKLKASIRWRITAVLIVAFLGFIFLLKDNGSINYGGFSYEVGSVFDPASYTSYGFFKTAESEINQLASQKRNGSLAGFIFCILAEGVLVYSLWKEDDIKDIILKIKNGEI